jgi:hypothetical protein
MIYKSSWNHKGNRTTFKCFFGCSIIVFPSVRWFFVFTIWSPYFGVSHLTHFFIFFNDSTFCGCANNRATIPPPLWDEIQRRTLRKFADLWDTKCLDTSLSTLPHRKTMVWLNSTQKWIMPSKAYLWDISTFGLLFMHFSIQFFNQMKHVLILVTLWIVVPIMLHNYFCVRGSRL